MGIPHVCNTGVGDAETIVKESGAGFAVTKFDEDEFENTGDETQKDIGDNEYRS